MIDSIGEKTLLVHQKVAVEWMMDRETDPYKQNGGLLCDEMGLGKTLSIIGLCINMPKPMTLLLCPLAVVSQWLAALKDADLTTYNFNGKEWVKAHEAKSGPAFHVSNTDKILNSPSAFKENWDRVIIDEAHIIRNSEGAKYVQINSLKRKTTWCLSATPIVNKIDDVASLLHLVNKRCSLKANKKRILECMTIFAMARSVSQIRETLSIFPKEAKTITHTIDFEKDEERSFYRGVQGALKEDLMEKIAVHDKNMTAIFEILLRLRQLSLHPQIYIDAKRKKLGKMYERPDWVGDSSKVGQLVSLITNSDELHKWVVFCQFHDEMTLIKARLEQESSIGQIWSYHGQIAVDERSKIIESTKTPLKKKHQVLLLQIHSGGTGLNLQHMDRVIFTSPWWTAALMDQAVGRVMRIGQKKDVEIHHLKLKEGECMNIDELIFSKVEQKRSLCQEILFAANSSIDLENTTY
jgi:SNF2 family DNA or RNA helicase